MLTIRLRRQGARNNPFYRVVLSDSRRTPRARTLEELGYYDPTRRPKVLSLKEERIDYWVSQGAIVSETLTKLRRKDFAADAEAAAPLPAKVAPSKEDKSKEAESASEAEAKAEHAEVEATSEEDTTEEASSQEAGSEAAEPDSEESADASATAEEE